MVSEFPGSVPLPLHTLLIHPWEHRGSGVQDQAQHMELDASLGYTKHIYVCVCVYVCKYICLKQKFKGKNKKPNPLMTVL